MPPRPAISTGLRPGLTPPPGQSYTGADGSKETPVRVLKGRAIGVTTPATNEVGVCSPHVAEEGVSRGIVSMSGHWDVRVRGSEAPPAMFAL